MQGHPPRLKWTAALNQRLLELLDEEPGTPMQAYERVATQLSDEAGVSVRPTQVKARFYALRPSGFRVAEQREIAPHPEPREPAWTLPARNGWLLMGDLHSPYVNWRLFAQAIETARERDIDALFIAGDLLDAGVFSPFPALLPQPSFEMELDAAEYALDLAARVLKVVRVGSGNHDYRVLKRMGAVLGAERATKMFLDLVGGAKNRDVAWSMYSYADIHSPAGLWRATHQRNFSRIRGRVAVSLAAKLKRHIVTFHEHGLAKLPSDCGAYTCIACGCMANIEMVDYLALVDSTAPTWQNGFVTLDNTGFGDLIGGPPGFSPPLRQ